MCSTSCVCLPPLLNVPMWCVLFQSTPLIAEGRHTLGSALLQEFHYPPLEQLLVIFFDQVGQQGTKEGFGHDPPNVLALEQIATNEQFKEREAAHVLGGTRDN